MISGVGNQGRLAVLTGLGLGSGRSARHGTHPATVSTLRGSWKIITLRSDKAAF